MTRRSKYIPTYEIEMIIKFIKIINKEKLTKCFFIGVVCCTQNKKKSKNKKVLVTSMQLRHLLYRIPCNTNRKMKCLLMSGV